MAVTFRGALVTEGLFHPATTFPFLVIDVSARSRCNVKILTMEVELEEAIPNTGAGRTIPVIQIEKLVGTASGGFIATDKVPFDTSINSPDSGVRIRINPCILISQRIIITGTPVTMWNKFTTRQANSTEQFRSCFYGFTVDFGSVLVRPGELIVMRWVDGTAPAGGSIFAKVAWEEDQVDAGFTVSGTVTLSGAPVTGAKVALLTDLDRDMPAPEVEVITTGAPGTWSKTLATGVKAAASVQYRDGETLYTDEGKPYLTST